MTRLTEITAEAVVPATAPEVWEALLDPARWRAWEHPAAKLQLDDVTLEDESFVRVGDRRRCSASLVNLPFGRRHSLTWDEQVTDVDPERTLEVESLENRSAIRRWRVRFWLLTQADGSTRLRCRVTYLPAALRGWLADRLFLRHRVAAAADAWLETLAASFRLEPIAFDPAAIHAEDEPEIEIEERVEHADSRPAPVAA